MLLRCNGRRTPVTAETGKRAKNCLSQFPSSLIKVFPPSSSVIIQNDTEVNERKLSHTPAVGSFHRFKFERTPEKCGTFNVRLCKMMAAVYFFQKKIWFESCLEPENCMNLCLEMNSAVSHVMNIPCICLRKLRAVFDSVLSKYLSMDFPLSCQKTSLYELKVICFLVLVIFAECAKKVSYKIIRFSFLNCFKMKEKRRQNTLRSKNVIYRAMNSYSKRIKKIRIAWISYRTSYLMEWIDHAFRIAISGVKAAHL